MIHDLLNLIELTDINYNYLISESVFHKSSVFCDILATNKFSETHVYNRLFHQFDTPSLLDLKILQSDLNVARTTRPLRAHGGL